MSSFLDPTTRADVPAPPGDADIVVGIPSYREADSIGHVVDQVARGLADHFPDLDGLVVNVDNASPDGTREAFLDAESHGVPRTYVSTPAGIAGKGRNFHNLFTLVTELRPRAVVVVDADLESVTPDWIRRFVGATLEGVDFVLPLYSRHPYDGTITNHLCYPLLYGLCGIDVRQPIGGDFAFRPWLAERWLELEWTDSICEYGIDITMTLEAIFSSARLGEVPLGAKIHKPSAPKLGEMFLQVVDSLFLRLLEGRERWDGAAAATPTGPEVHGEAGVTAPQHVELDAEAMAAQARHEFQDSRETLRSVLRARTFATVEGCFSDGSASVAGLDTDPWIDCLFDALDAYARGRREAAVAALRPLYMGRVVAFVSGTRDVPWTVAEEVVREQARRLHERRLDLLRRLPGTA